MLVLAFESADHALEPWMKRALECCADLGGKIPEDAGQTRTDAEATHEGAAGAWRNAFLNAPYLTDIAGCDGNGERHLRDRDHVGPFSRLSRASDGDRRRDAIRRICGKGTMTCRFTHVYPDGPAPYYTILAPGKRGLGTGAMGRNQGGGVRGNRSSSAARSRIIMRSAATIGHGTIGSGPTASRGL